MAWNANNGTWGYLTKEGYGGQCLGSISCYSYGIDKVYIFLDFRSFIGDFAYHFWKLRPFKRRWCIANFTPNITKTAEEYSVDSKCFWIAYISFITICPTIRDNNNTCLRSGFSVRDLWTLSQIFSYFRPSCILNSLWQKYESFALSLMMNCLNKFGFIKIKSFGIFYLISGKGSRMHVVTVREIWTTTTTKRLSKILYTVIRIESHIFYS